jgi:tight adherence protein B
MTLALVLLVFLGTFLLAAAAVIAADLLFERQAEKLVTLDVAQEPPDPEWTGDSALLRDQELSTISPLARLLEQFDFIEGLGNQIVEADLNWSVGRVTGLMLLFGAVGFAIGNAIYWVPLLGKFALAVFIGLTPYFYILKKRGKRLTLLQDQFPEVVDTMARAMRAGHPFAGALDLAANQAPNPLARELRKTFTEGAFGMPWEQALENLTRRVRLPEIAVFVAAVQMQSRTGGNLAEVFDKLSENIREAAAVRGEVRSFSNQGRLAGNILTVLPVGIAVALVTVNRTFLDPLFEEQVGRYMLTGACCGLVLAHFVIRKLVDIRL